MTSHLQSRDDLLPILEQGLACYNLQASLKQHTQLLDFVFALAKWNKVHNLTALTAVDEMLTKHVLDSLVVAKFIPNGRILDVGTGAGLPGLPLAIMHPDLEFVLLDKCRKKTAFVQHAITLLGLPNVSVQHARVEDYASSPLFAMIVSRAYAALDAFVISCAHLCHEDGFFLAMKGKIQQVQTESLPDGYQLTKIEAVTVPGELGERCLVFISKNNNTA